MAIGGGTTNGDAVTFGKVPCALTKAAAARKTVKVGYTTADLTAHAK